MKKTGFLLLAVGIVLIISLSGCTEEDKVYTATPTIAPDGGIANYEQEVTITCSETGAKIYYTTDGTDPTTSSTEYTGTAITVSGDGTETEIRAIAKVDEKEASEVATSTYSINYGVYPAITGAITTGTGVSINSVKIGLFFKGDAADGPNPTTNINLNDSVTAESGKLYYDDGDVADGTDVSIAPERLGSIDTAEATYALPLPLDIPARGVSSDLSKWSEGYYAIAWFDSDNDGNLDLKDGPVTYASQGEYNRMAVKSVTFQSVPDTSCFLDFIEQDELDADNYQFKYYSVADTSQTDHIAHSSDTMGDFDFTISAEIDN